MMPLIFATFLLAGDADSNGHLYQPAYCLDDLKRGPARPYCPQPGDMLLATDDNFFWKITHNLAWTGHPHHTGVVFQRCDGSMAILEGGPNDTRWIRTLDLVPHLREYEEKGQVWIRARKTPLTPEQSKCLTEFAEANDGKKFAIARLGFQLTVFRPRGPFGLKTALYGKAKGNRNRYYCSELALEALVACGALNPDHVRPAATYPRDLFFDSSPNPWINKHTKLCECWDPPALWTLCPEACPCGQSK